MNDENVNVNFYAACAAAVGVSAIIYLKVRRTERKKRAIIKREQHLNMMAVHYASARAKKNMASCETLPSLNVVMENYYNDIEFQKIVLQQEL